jgi:hypothetical protein
MLNSGIGFFIHAELVIQRLSNVVPVSINTWFTNDLHRALRMARH